MNEKGYFATFVLQKNIKHDPKKSGNKRNDMEIIYGGV
jgi:hypothetical protein